MFDEKNNSLIMLSFFSEAEQEKIISRIIPIIAMTANAFNENRRAAEACGMNGFVSKPINMEEIVQTLERIFNSI
ncbi:MAG: hypothetical protein PUF14_11515 [Clostridiales bacterium]|nr:hypothetical protein [Lachnospiraceae bacterium]MDD6619196.1 hypothetical protein [Clostridiales bacterium]